MTGTRPDPAPTRRAHTRQRHRRAVSAFAALLAATSFLTSCVLAEGEEYVIQSAPPNGIHATIRPKPTRLLVALSALVDQGADADRFLALARLRTRCNSYPNTASYGDRCAFRVLRENRVVGGLAGSWWSDATNWDMFTDFSRDAIGAFRASPAQMQDGCLHVTIRNMGDWPIEWKNSNWTVRTRSDSRC